MEALRDEDVTLAALAHACRDHIDRVLGLYGVWLGRKLRDLRFKNVVGSVKYPGR